MGLPGERSVEQEPNEPRFMKGGGGGADGAQPPAPPPQLTPSHALPGNEEPTDRGARLLVDQLLKFGYHPVILCGTSNAGKTCALASLCSFLKLGGRASVDFGPWPSDGGSDENTQRLRQAESLFHEVVNDFKHGLAPRSTGAGLPYVVPIEIMPKHNSAARRDSNGGGNVAPVRLAIMDMGGELFKPAPETPGYRPPPSDVAQVLRLYSRSVSMVYMGPTTRLAGYKSSNDTRLEPHESESRDLMIKEDPDAALINAIKGYEKVRPNRRSDRHLFVLSKWDLAVPVDEPDFEAPERAMIEHEIEKRFPEAWAAYQAMRVNPRAKWVVQYSAGIISDRTVTSYGKDTPERDKLDDYAKVMWNWLYRGATRSTTSPSGLMLFPELLPVKVPWWSRLFAGTGQ